MACRVHYLTMEETCEIQRAEEHTAPVPEVRAKWRVNRVMMMKIFCVLLVAGLVSLSVYYLIKLNHNEQELEEIRNANYILISNNSALQSQYVTLNEKLDEVTKEFSVLKDLYCDGTNTSPDNTCSLCKPGWFLFSSKCYFISIKKLTWKESRDWCEIRGGRLVNIESSDVLIDRYQDFIKSKADIIEDKGIRYWIGRYNISKENKSTKMGAEPVKSKRASDDDKEECLEMDMQLTKVYDYNYGEPSRWICESAVFQLRI